MTSSLIYWYDKYMKNGTDYIGVGVGIILVNQNGELFLVKRGHKAKNEKYTWEFPGGAVDFGETRKDAVIRELKEEFGVAVAVDCELMTHDHIITNEGQHWVSTTYLGRIMQGDVKIMEPDKHEAIGWHHPTKLPKPLSSISKANIRKYLQVSHSS